MAAMTLESLAPVIQLAVGPAILISGVGMLLMGMNNRIGRVIDRARVVAQMRRTADDSTRPRYQAQSDILWRRAQLMRMAMSQAAAGALFAAALVICLFVEALLDLDAVWIPVALFIGCMASIILSLTTLIRDINLSLHALKLDMDA